MRFVKIFILTMFMFYGVLNVVNVSASTISSGEIVVNKSASIIEESDYRSASVLLNVKTGSAYTETKETEIILVLDRSSSMNKDLNNEERDKDSKMKITKDAAKKFVNSILNDSTKNKVKIGVVVYGTDIINYFNLNSDIKKINKFIDDIDNLVEDEGTNIQVGLKQASTLFTNSTDSNKSIVLLTDGDPTYYTDSNNIIHGTGNSDQHEKSDNYKWNKDTKQFDYYDFDNKTILYSCYFEDYEYLCTNNIGPKPSEKTIEEASIIKTNGINIYSLGLKMTNSTLLETISTKTFYVDKKEDLNKEFDNIFKTINKVAQDVVVTDIIPSNFILDETSLLKYKDTVEYKNGVITWTIGDLLANKEYELTYKITAVDPHYGSMYTNQSAILNGKPSINNPFYKDIKNLSIPFNKPVVPIPSITKSESYSVNGNKLVVDSLEGILSNDSLKQNRDNEATIVDRIVIIPESLTNATLKDIIMNNDGSFMYNSVKDFNGTVSFEYYIESTITINDIPYVVKSNKSRVLINVTNKNEVVNTFKEEFNTPINTSNNKSIVPVTGIDSNYGLEVAAIISTLLLGLSYIKFKKYN